MSIDLNQVDESVLSSLKEYGKIIQKYKLSYLIKRDVACSDLELTNSLHKLADSGLIKKVGSNKYLINS